jgi:NADH dehydrogenase/NADH:ubiquinone oxidoreductase subunit G
MVANDPQRCILCKRCTRVCDEWMGEERSKPGIAARTPSSALRRLAELFAVRQLHRSLSDGTLLDGTYRHQHRPWELNQTISTCTYCSDGCQTVVGSRGRRSRAHRRARSLCEWYNGEFLCVKGRFGHPFINHAIGFARR